MTRIVAIGGGIAGLAAAHRIVELNAGRSSPIEIVLLEASSRIGGAIATEQVGDFLVEGGPDSFITEKPSALRLCERLGLAPRLVSTQSAFQKIHVVRGGKLEALPEGFFLLAPTRLWPFLQTPLFSWSGKLRIAAEIMLPRGQSADESLGAFVRRRFGREALERVAQPLIGGIYASDPDRLSLNATMPRFHDMERQHGSVIRAMWSEQRRRARQRESGSGARWSLFVTLAGGMYEMVEAMAKHFPDGSLRLDASAVELKRTDTNKWDIVLADGSVIAADGVVLAAPASQTASMLKSIAQDAASDLQQITYASTATVSFAYRSEDFPKQPDSFGFVVPAIERRKIVACTFSSLKYPGRAPRSHILLRAFVGGALQPELFDADDATMESNVRSELSRLLGVTAQPQFSRLWRHPNSMPQYHVGHPARVQRIESSLSSFSTLALAGSAYHGVGIADCVRTGEEAAEKVFGSLANS
jgi:oxygen-dependent protoporphyrinogen oxidase